MAKIRLIKNSYFNWVRRLTLFISIFGTIWLFLEPLSSLKLGIIEYFGMLAGSLMITVAIELIFILKDKKNYKLFTITIIIREDGRRYKVEASKDMLVGNFIKKFAQAMDENMNMIKWNVENAKVILEFNKQNRTIQADNNKSFEEQAITEKDECSLRVYPKYTGGGGGGGKRLR